MLRLKCELTTGFNALIKIPQYVYLTLDSLLSHLKTV